MATSTERIPVLVIAQEKAQIAAKAKAAGTSMSEFLRRAAASYRPPEDDQLLEGMIDKMMKTTTQANAAIDDALAFIEASNTRIAELEGRQKLRRRAQGTDLVRKRRRLAAPLIDQSLPIHAGDSGSTSHELLHPVHCD